MTRIRTTAVVVALAVVLASCGGTDATRDDIRPQAAPSTTGPPDGRTSDTTPAPKEELDDGIVVPRSAPDGSDPDPSRPAAPRTTGDPAPATPARAGIYRYDTEGTTRVSDGPPRELPKVTTLTIDPPHNDRQRSLRDLRDRDGAGSTTERIQVYATDGVHLAYLKLQTDFAGIRSTYEFKPSDPPLVVRTGAQPGDQTSFSLKGDGVTIQATATIREIERVDAAGTAVSALVLELVSTLSGELEGTQTAISWIDTDRSLTVKEDVDTDVSSGAVRIRTKYVASVQELSPA